MECHHWLATSRDINCPRSQILSGTMQQTSGQMFPTAWESNVVRNVAQLIQYSTGTTQFTLILHLCWTTFVFVFVKFCWRTPQLHEHLLASVKSLAQKRCWHMFEILRRHFYPVPGDQAVWQSRRLYKLRLTENHQPVGYVTICLTPISWFILEKF